MQKHFNHLVDPSPWPIITSFTTFSLLVGVVMYMHAYAQGLMVVFLGFSGLLYSLWLWWRDIIREGTYEGRHTNVVQVGLRYGMVLFILSEVCFFVAFFWAFFHSSLSPTIEIGSIWPPEGIIPFNPWEVPLLNTLILLLSGATITWSHHAIIGGDKRGALEGLEYTIVLAIIFTLCQVYEYFEAPFSFSDGIYGSTFFLATGFHGAHVIIGTLIIFVMMIRLYLNHFTKEHHFGFEAGAWYWHFVDVVWLFLFVSIYWWGSA
jgi:heme/copper-type cytochrome/quinol oxidase subunit 3